MPRKIKTLLLFLSFLEGGVVMVSELVGAKLLAPVFGTSLYVWAAVLGVTLGGLASGYFLGGILSKNRKNKIQLLYIILISAGILVAVMPGLSSLVFRITVDMSIRAGSVSSLLTYMFPALVLFGMTSPLIIGVIADKNQEEAGRSAGQVYAISTLGGIIFTFAAGFYLLPEKGILFSAVSTGILMASIPFILLLLKSREKGIAMLFIAAGFLLFLRPSKTIGNGMEILYDSDGIFGQLRVVDMFEQNGNTTRALLVNSSGQTMVNLDNPGIDIWSYTAFMPHVVRELKPDKTLLIGLGGGTLLNRISPYTNTIKVVELDERIRDVARDFFYLKNSGNVIIDDGRHFLKQATERFDLIVYDAFQSETPPVHLYTMEAFKEAQERLNPGGHILINFYGFTQGERGNAAISLYKTLQKVFPDVAIFRTGLSSDEIVDNLLIAAGPEVKRILRTPGHPLLNYLVNLNPQKLNELPVYTDNLPVMEKMYLGPALAWRNSWIDYYLNRPMTQQGR